jgi:predicted nuclease with TOPRIM domain
MSKLADQIEEIEENLADAEMRVHDLEEDAKRMLDEISDLEDVVAEHEEYIEWIDETYPEARIAYEAKQRLDSAAV